jgi:hypothetical protein
MIQATLLREWASQVECAALIAIVVLALSVIVRAVKLGDAVRHLGVILGHHHPASHAARHHCGPLGLFDI